MLAWPDGLCPISGGFAPFVRSLSGGQSLNGFEQVQPQLHDRWTAAFTFRLKDKASILRMRALLTQLRGRSGSILVPTFENARAPLSAATPGTPIGAVVSNPPFWTRWPHLIGTPYEYSALPGITGSATIVSADRIDFTATGDAPEVGQAVTLQSAKRIITLVEGSNPYRIRFHPHLTIGVETPGTVAATLRTSALINATSIVVDFTAGGPPQPGHFFSIGNRLHSCDTVTEIAPDRYTLGIWPWLRAAATAGATINFSAPACEMRLASDAEGADTLRSLAALRFGDATLRFDEVAVI